MKLDDKIMMLRKQKGWSQEELAFRLDVSRQAVSKWELGTCIPDLDKIIKMSELFEVTTDYLVKGEQTYEHKIEKPDEKIEKVDTNDKVSRKYEGLVGKITIVSSFLLSLVIIVYFLIGTPAFLECRMNISKTLIFNLLLLGIKFLVVVIATRCNTKALWNEFFGFLISLTLYLPFYLPYKKFVWYMSSLNGGDVSSIFMYMLCMQLNLSIGFIVLAVRKKKVVYLLNTIICIICVLKSIFYETPFVAILVYSSILLGIVLAFLIKLQKIKLDLLTVICIFALFVIAYIFFQEAIFIENIFIRSSVLICVAFFMQLFSFSIKKPIYVKHSLSFISLIFILYGTLQFVRLDIISLRHFDFLFLTTPAFIIYIIISNLLLCLNFWLNKGEKTNEKIS